MIADAAYLLLLLARDIVIACTLIVAAACIYAWCIRHWDASVLRQHAKRQHKAGGAAARRSPTSSDRFTETRAAANRDHPLHSLGGRFR